MANQLFVNLPVADLGKSMEFFSKLGFSFNKQFTNNNGACLVLGPNFYAMLLVEEFFKSFTKRPIPDARAAPEVLVSLMVESRVEVDRLVNAAVAAGGKAGANKQELAFMYGWGFEDLDGHNWEVGWMDPAHIQPVELI